MAPAPVVLIAPTECLAGLIKRLDDGAELLTFSDADPLDALEAITTRKPTLVVIERLFAASSRGEALIDRIKDDPALHAVEIRVLSHDTDHVRVASTGRPAGATSSESATDTARLDYHGTRRATRFKIRSGVEIKVDGDPATVVDMSRIGAQVMLAGPVRPYQRVRVALGTDAPAVRCSAAIAWCRYELRPGEGGYYRAGLEFTEADSDAVEAFYAERTDAEVAKS